MRMKYAISAMLVLGIWGSQFSDAQSPMREQALRNAALDAGVVPLQEIQIQTDTEMVAVGEKLFESTLLSFNGKTSCQTCHLDKFSSADGLPNAIGTRGEGEGDERLMSGGDVVPRNTLALWGRGSKGFDTFFWDGKVHKAGPDIISQFGPDSPSTDPLVVAVHLPFVEIREMVVRDDTVKSTYEKEDTSSAGNMYAILVERLKQDKSLSIELSEAANVSPENLEFGHIADAVANFIRSNFAVEDTKFDSFMFENAEFSKDELQGGLIFYGKGQCSSCHSGPLMTDLDFHVMPFQQLGFGKNGFGVDYGRFNATLNEEDTYKFRTPPLINVTKTAPYSHSGAYSSLKEMIIAHVDPLAEFDGNNLTAIQRREFIAKLAKWQESTAIPESLSETEIDYLISFLETIEVEGSPLLEETQR